MKTKSLVLNFTAGFKEVYDSKTENYITELIADIFLERYIQMMYFSVNDDCYLQMNYVNIYEDRIEKCAMIKQTVYRMKPFFKFVFAAEENESQYQGIVFMVEEFQNGIIDLEEISNNIF